MSFDDIVLEVMGRLGLTSDEAEENIGRKVNMYYKRATSKIGVQVARPAVGIVGTTTEGVQTVTFTGIEKVDRVYTDASGTRKFLDPRTFNEIEQINPIAGTPTRYADQEFGSGYVTIRLDALPQSIYDYKADGLATAATLSGSQVPQLPESYHDVLVEGAYADTLRDLERPKTVVDAALEIYKERLSDLQYFIAKSGWLKLRQGGATVSSLLGAASGASGGVSTSGGTSYTQTGLITFDRDPGAPFAVTSGSAVVPNLDADLLDGQHGSYYLSRANHTGTYAHATTHQSGGADEINVTGLSGLLADGQTPLAHAASHGPGQSDALKLDDLATPDDNTDLNASTARHGLLKKLSNVASEFMNGQGNWAAPTVVAGADTQVQFNDGGALGADAGLVYDKTNNRLTTDLLTLLGGQIVFPASQNASSNANTLDDYEEGTWTPTDASGASLSFTAVEGYYVKVGKKVTVTAVLTFPSTGSGAGVVFGGLPFTVEDTTNDCWVGLLSCSTQAAASMTPVNNGTTVVARSITTGNAAQNSTFTLATVRFTLTYRATA